MVYMDHDVIGLTMGFTDLREFAVFASAVNEVLRMIRRGDLDGPPYVYAPQATGVPCDVKSTILQDLKLQLRGLLEREAQQG